VSLRDNPFLFGRGCEGSAPDPPQQEQDRHPPILRPRAAHGFVYVAIEGRLLPGSCNAWRSTFIASLAMYLREKVPVESFFELFLKGYHANERVFGASVADFAADFMVKLGHDSHDFYCNLW